MRDGRGGGGVLARNACDVRMICRLAPNCRSVLISVYGSRSVVTVVIKVRDFIRGILCTVQIFSLSSVLNTFDVVLLQYCKRCAVSCRAQNLPMRFRPSGNPMRFDGTLVKASLYTATRTSQPFPVPVLHDTRTCSAVLCADRLYRILVNSVNKYGKYGQKFIYAVALCPCSWSTCNQYISVDTCTEFPNQTIDIFGFPKVKSKSSLSMLCRNRGGL